jgi:hypothetical protein
MGNVALIAPDGRTFDVPEENVEAAKQDGWKLASASAEQAMAELAPPAPAAPTRRTVSMMATDGRMFYVPEENL